MSEDRSPGWDKRSINAIAARDYGGLQGLFAAHGWHVGDRAIGQIAPTRVVETYGSVEAFDAAHPAVLPAPLAALERPEPDVWLTSYHGFTPDSWGLLGFTFEWMRRNFLAKSKPGALVVIYGTGQCEDPDERGRILGVQQQSHILGHKKDFVPPERWEEERSDPARVNKWTFAVKVDRAWRVTPETRPTVQQFAPVTYPGRAQLIGAQGMRLTPAEARNLLELDLEEVEVFGGGPVDILPLSSAEEVLRPSKAGPVSSTGHWRKEAEGPKHLYVLELNGNAEHFMGKPIGDHLVVKVGMSRSPATRRDDHNRALPQCAFRWVIARSTFAEGRQPFPNSPAALAGEQVMKDHLEVHGRSLGGEFFLARPADIDAAWARGLVAAQEWTEK